MMFIVLIKSGSRVYLTSLLAISEEDAETPRSWETFIQEHNLDSETYRELYNMTAYQVEFAATPSSSRRIR